MKKKLMKTAIVPMMIWAASMPLMQSCIDEEMPTDYATDQQIEESSTAAQSLVNGLNALMVDQFTYNGDQVAYDWGYPCQMVIRDILGGDMPVTGIYDDGSSWDYLSWIADGTYLSYTTLYTFSYYYKLVSNANKIIEHYANTESDYKEYGGMALAYRAMAYMDLARMFEYRTTGFESLDAKATDVMGLTVPIVTEKTTIDEARNNPRAPFYTMYRFIMSDLNLAETLLADYVRSSKQMPDVSVIYGLKARLWLEMATRFEKSADDLATFMQHKSDNDGYDAVDISTADDCYANALGDAQRAINFPGYTPLTKDQWNDTKTGFNTANNAWMWAASMRSKEMLSAWWFSWLCWMSPESTTLSWGQNYDSYRAIDANLYSNIGNSDWRKKSWVDPQDAYAKAVPEGYSTILRDKQWATLPAYTSLKFRLNGGEQSDYNVAMLCDIPLMRIEEMYFIAVEAAAHVNGIATGAATLEYFMNSCRYTDGSYKCEATTMKMFTLELMQQKRVEFWGEGLTYFDNKRLALGIQRYYYGSNYPDSYQLNSIAGYVAPWLNYYIYDYERDQNQAVILNPDLSGVVQAKTNAID